MTGLIILTGGSRGIGAATVRLAVSRGYAVCFSYLRQQAVAEALVAELRASGGQVWAVQADVGQEADVQRLFATADGLGLPLIGLVNNAGILERQMRLVEMDAARWQRVLQANVIGSFLCTREAVQRMSTRLGGQGGSIVNVSSGAARGGSPFEYIDYAASKGAMDSMTIGLSKEVAAEGIRVNAVRPGVIETDIHADGGEPGRVARLASTVPMQRGGQPEEVAEAILWLLSDAASFSTGAFIDVTGGR